MAYATPEQLAAALETRCTDENRAVLQACLDAAAAEIDHALAGHSIEASELPLVGRTNINRACEWFKAPATFNGGVGAADAVGTMQVPTSGFGRHAAALVPLKHDWGIA